jgi:hypothetical protein
MHAVEVCGISLDHVTERDTCIRCGESASIDESVYCGHCYWRVRAEIEAGMYELRVYLAHWREFRDWEAGHSERS